MPSIFGIAKSRMTMSGSSSRARSRARRPSVAVATTSKSVPNTRDTASSMGANASATNTRGLAVRIYLPVRHDIGEFEVSWPHARHLPVLEHELEHEDAVGRGVLPARARHFNRRSESR